MRILTVIPDLSPLTGGPVTVTYGLSQALAEAGHVVDIASSDWGYDPVHHDERITVHTFPCRYDRWRWAPGLGRFLRSNARNYDIVMIGSLWQYASVAGSHACRAANVPYIVSTHGMLGSWSVSQKTWKKLPYLSLIESRVLRGAAALHATTDHEYEHSSMARWNRWSAVLPLGLKPDAYQNLPSRTAFAERFPILKDRPYLLFLGRVHYKKQPEILIRAFAEISKLDRDLLLVIAGPGSPEYLDRMKAVAEGLNIGHRVVFTGMLTGQVVTEAFRGAVAFCLPSLSENFGVSVIEAMATECPVLISDCVDIAPMVLEANAGLVTEPNVASTVAGLRELLADEPVRIRMGQNGRRFVLQNLTWKKVAGRFVEVFEDILGKTHASKAWRESDGLSDRRNQ